jgi:hypothetical protein
MHQNQRGDGYPEVQHDTLQGPSRHITAHLHQGIHWLLEGLPQP